MPKKLLPIACVGLLLFGGCAANQKRLRPDVGDGGTIFSVLKVKDLDAWRTSFDRAQGARSSAGLLGHEVLLATDDSSQVLVVLDLNSALMAGRLMKMGLHKQWVAADQASSASYEVGGKIIKGVGSDSLMADEVGYVWVRHAVKNLDEWLKAYKAHAGHHDSATRGYRAVGHRVHADQSYTSVVHVTHWVDNVDKASEFMDSAELRTAMAKAGVIGEPRIWIGRRLEQKSY